MASRVAALYVDLRRGPYANMPGVIPFGLPNDARLYTGPYPVVAHPSCAPWGRLAAMHGRGDSERDGDKSCGPIAVEQVRRFGGVLEHPQGSSLWRHMDMPFPGRGFDRYGGYTIVLNQCDFGHKCKKATWLYIVGVHPSKLPPLPPPGRPTHSMGMTREKRELMGLPELPKSQRHITPKDFAEWLVSVARMAELHLDIVTQRMSPYPGRTSCLTGGRMKLTQPQATAIRTCIESDGGRVRFTRSFFSGKELPRGTIPAITARKLVELGLGSIESGPHKDEGFFCIADSGRNAYTEHRERLLKENQNER